MRYKYSCCFVHPVVQFSAKDNRLFIHLSGREREGERQTDRDIETEREGERDRQTERQRQRELMQTANREAQQMTMLPVPSGSVA